MNIGELKAKIEGLPDTTHLLAGLHDRCMDNQAWAVLRSNVGTLENGEKVFIISRFLKYVLEKVKT